MTVVLDASALIAHLDGHDQHHDAVEALLLGATGRRLAASPITLAEVLVGPARVGQLDRAVRTLETLAVVTVALTPGSPARLASLRAQTGLRLPDCWVLLAADAAPATVITFDGRLAAAGRTLGLEVLGA